MIKKLIAVYARVYTEKIKLIICLLFLLVFTQFAHAQSKGKKALPRCGFTSQLMEKVDKEVAGKISNLRNEGKLDFKKNGIAAQAGAAVAPVQFIWPLTTKEYRDFPSWRISNFMDQDRDTGDYHIKNYTCYAYRSYDQHTGTDILIEPYTWKLKDEGFVRVVAAADGIIVDKHDGEYDENCAQDTIALNFLCKTYPNNQGNYIVILHNDGTTATFYMHMKNGSLTDKQEGDAVKAGDYLGTVGSAGCSTDPHLHFEVREGYINDAVGLDGTIGHIKDPFFGTCSNTDASYWIDQKPYDDPSVLTLETHSSNPDQYDSACDKTINLYFDNSFTKGQTIWFRTKLRDFNSGGSLTHYIYYPGNASAWQSFSVSNPDGYRGFLAVDHGFTVPSSPVAGTYRYTVKIGGKSYSHYFAINCEATKNLSGTTSSQRGYMVSDSITSTQSINGSDTNYIKYMADKKVVLKAGFWAKTGCRFVANTEGCNNSTANFNKTSKAETVSAAAKDQLITKEKTGTNLVVFPNPSAGVFTVRYSNTEKFTASVAIRNLLGQVVYSIPAREYQHQLLQQVNLTGKPKGIYLVEIVSGDKRITSKVMVQ